MKRKVTVILLIILILIIGYRYIASSIQSKLLTNLDGTIYYLERVDGVLTLFKSDASLENKTLLYSHKGKGQDGYGGYNDNIIDFYYDKTSQTINFIAMNNGYWSLFSLKEDENKTNILKKDVMEIKTDYIHNEWHDLTIYSNKGSLYLSENGEEKTIKKFSGIYDEKFTGYNPIGISPDGKYLVYYSTGHLTSIGTIIDGFITDSVGETYIMDLSTAKSTKYVNASQIQWVVD